MNYDDTGRVIERLKGGWAKRLTDDTYGIWCEELETLDFSPAYAAARGLIRTSKYFPAISEFLAAYQQHERDQAPHVDTPPACPMCDGGWVVTDDQRNEVVPCSRCRRDQYDTWARGQVPRTEHPPTTAMFERRVADPETAATIERLRAVRDEVDAMREVLNNAKEQAK